MGPKGLTFPRLSLSNCERDRSDEPVRIFYSAEPSVGSKSAIGCSNILSFGKPLEGLKAGNRRSNNRTIYVRMRLTIYLFIYLFNYLDLNSNSKPNTNPKVPRSQGGSLTPRLIALFERDFSATRSAVVGRNPSEREEARSIPSDFIFREKALQTSYSSALAPAPRSGSLGDAQSAYGQGASGSSPGSGILGQFFTRRTREGTRSR